MPLQLHPMAPGDTLSWTRIRAQAYYGPTHDVLHRGPVSELSIRGVAQEQRKEIGKANTWHWKIVDTELDPGDDDDESNGGRTIAVAVWNLCNVAQEEKHRESKDETLRPFIPPELRLDALEALIGPLRLAQKEIMGDETPYLMLNTLVTHPEHQHRGAGKMLLGWGLHKADEEELPTYLD